MNRTCGKVVHRETMDGGFTVRIAVIRCVNWTSGIKLIAVIIVVVM